MTTETNAKIICDSVTPAGHRLTTFEAVYPRIVLAEVNTHRTFTRSSASSRAIPVEKMIRRVIDEGYIPIHWGKNQKGMQAEQDLDGDDALKASNRWREARAAMVRYASELLDIGVHKQITNRLLEPFMWHPTLITATEWGNFFNLRDNKDAHPDFRDLAHAMRELRQKHEPKLLTSADWHMPLIFDEDWEQAILEDPTHPTEVQSRLVKVSVGRCARITHLTHDGRRDLKEDVGLHDRILAPGHMAPFEHVARPMSEHELELFAQKKMRWDLVNRRWYWVGATYYRKTGKSDLVSCSYDQPDAGPGNDGEYTHFLGNVQGWVQYRKLIPHEEDILGARP